MRRTSSIRSGWFRLAISFCRARAWRGCTILVCTLAALLAVSWFTLDWTDAGASTYPGGVVIRDDAGNVLRVALGEGDVDCRPYYVADRNDWIVKALVAAEDGTFWEHRGVRPLSVLRAAVQNVFYRRRISGASTLTMQAVRLIAPHPKTLWWKYKEAFYALKMERRKNKTWILSQYLNRAPFGSNFIGIEAAANGWFGKGAKDLGLSEAAMLAGMVQAPSRFRPDRGYARALKRRDYVLGRMRELGFITDEQRLAATSVRPAVRRAPRPFATPHFCDWVLADRMRRGETASGEIRTALNADLQKVAESAVAGAFASSAAVILRVATGDVVAMAVSGDYFDPKGGQVNTALAPRPAGSTLKPFLAALAMDRGLVTPETRLIDRPVAYRGYRPANFDGRYRGRVTLRDSLVLSLNVPFVRLLDEIGVTAFADCLRGLGFRHLNETADRLGLGLAIGNAEVTLLELARAYRQLACGGGETFSSEAAYLVSDILSGNERSSAALGHVADVAAPRLAWKTGTSSAYRDAWTLAWNPEYVIGVWCGHKSGGFGDTSIVGAKAAAPIAWTIARAIYPRNDGPWFAKPLGIVSQEICSLSGRPANGACPRTERGRTIAGRSSPQVCTCHVIGPDGELVTRDDDAHALRIVKPESGAVFRQVEGVPQQRIVCEVAGVDATTRLWWFVDGVAAGETTGIRPFTPTLAPGDHEIRCVTASEESASVRVCMLECNGN